MKTRCKFVVTSITRHGYQGMQKDAPKHETVKLVAVYGDHDPENQSFAEATPQGSCEIYVSNPAVVGTFDLGSLYYLDLTPVPAKG